MKTLKHGFRMENPSYIGFQNYQPVTTKEILYSDKRNCRRQKKKNLCSWAWTINLNVQALNHTVVTEEQANNIQSKIKVSGACF